MANTEKYEYAGSCVSQPFTSVKQLMRIVNSGIEITQDTFFRRCAVPEPVKRDMALYPDDYEYYRGRHIRKHVYYYVHSRIEYFFVQA